LSTPALTFDKVSKRFGLRGKLALNELSFSVPTGSITGFVGPNGAGKTTTFSVVSGFLEPDAGKVDILGEGPFEPMRLKGRVGVLPQDAELPDRHTPLELLTHLACLQGMSRGEGRKEAERLVELVRLDDRRDHRITTLSHGMRRRVAVASALCGSPQLVLLDEPLAGLDPSQAYSLRDRLAELRGKQTLVVSSHNLAEVERLCDYVVMVQDGRCMRQGPMAELTGADEMSRWQLVRPLEPAEIHLLTEALPESVSMRVDGSVIELRTTALDDEAATVAMMGALASVGVPLRSLGRGVGLERRFLDDQAG
jgi:ABC-2 type transport system ATP-binding protein